MAASSSAGNAPRAQVPAPMQIEAPRWVLVSNAGTITAEAADPATPIPAGSVRVLATGALEGPAVIHMTAATVGNLEKLPVFSIRNGELAEARALMLHTSIPSAFHWVPIIDLPTSRALHHVEVFIRCALAQMHNRAPPGWGDALRKKAAMVLGVARAMATAYFDITTNDLVAGETATPVMRYALLPNGTGVVVTEPNLPAEIREILTRELVFSEDEKSIIGVLATSTVGVVAVQGYSIVMMGHHYMSHGNNQSKRAYDAIEKQFWEGLPGALRDWFQADLDVVRDMAWHKSCHPINMAIKVNMAKQERVKEMLKAAGAGSAAARLPAVESEMRAANSYLTLGITVGAMLETVNGGIDLSVLINAMELVRSHSVEGANRPPSPVPGVTDKPSALAYLNRVLLVNSGTIAYCYGFYCAMGDRQTMTAGKPVGESLRKSHSLLKLENGNPAAYMGGRMGYEDYQAAANAKRAKGRYTPPSLRLKDGSEQQVPPPYAPER